MCRPWRGFFTPCHTFLCSGTCRPGWIRYPNPVFRLRAGLPRLLLARGSLEARNKRKSDRDRSSRAEESWCSRRASDSLFLELHASQHLANVGTDRYFHGSRLKTSCWLRDLYVSYSLPLNISVRNVFLAEICRDRTRNDIICEARRV